MLQFALRGIFKIIFILFLCFNSIVYSGEVYISDQFILSKLDSTLQANSTAKVQMFFSAPTLVIIEDSYLFNEQSLQPLNIIFKNGNKLPFYKWSDGALIDTITLNSKETAQISELLSLFVVDYHLQSPWCYADTLISFWDTLKTFPLIDSSVYSEHYGEKRLTWLEMRILSHNYEREKGYLEVMEKRFNNNGHLEFTDIFLLENQQRILDRYRQQLFSNMVHRMAYEELLSIPQESLSNYQRIIVDTYDKCRKFNNEDFILIPVLFPQLFCNENNNTRINRGINRGVLLKNVEVTDVLMNKIVLYHQTEGEMTFIHETPVFDRYSTDSKHLIIPEITGYNLWFGSPSVIDKGLVPPLYFLPEIRSVMVDCRWGRYVINGFSKEGSTLQQLEFPYESWFPKEVDSFRAKVVSVSGFWDSALAKLYPANRPYPDIFTMPPSIYYRVTDTSNVIEEYSLDLDPRMVGQEATWITIERKYNFAENLSLRTVPLKFYRPEYLKNVRIRNKSKKPVTFHGVRILYSNGYLMDLAMGKVDYMHGKLDSERNEIALGQYFPPGWVKEIEFIVEGSQTGQVEKPKNLNILVCCECLMATDKSTADLYSETRNAAEIFLKSGERILPSREYGLPFVTIHAVIPD